MCFGGNKSSSSSNGMNFTNQTTSTKYDPWATQGAQDVFGNAQSWLQGHPWQGYSGPTSAAFGPEFGKASEFLGGNLGHTNAMTTQAGGALSNLIGSIDPNRPITSYMSDYTGAVLDPVIRKINEAAGAQGSALAGQATLAGQYGGTGQGVMQALLNRDTQRNIADATGQAYNQAYTNAQATRQGLLQTLLGGSQALAGVGQNEFGQGTTLASLLAGIGAQRQQAGQQGIQNEIAINTQNQTMPLNQATMLAQILAGVPKNNTQNTIGIGVNQGSSTTSQPNNTGFSLLGAGLGSFLGPMGTAAGGAAGNWLTGAGNA